MKNKFIIFILMLTMILSLASCGFVVEEEGLIIESITTEVVKEGEYKGQTKVTITYANMDEEPSVFYIPKGEDGLVGVGIEDITAKPGENNDKVIEITLSDGSVKTYNVENPISIVDTFRVEKDGNWYLVITYSNGDSDEVPLEEGPAGKDGLTCTEVKTIGLVTEADHPFEGMIEVMLVFSDGKENGERLEQFFYVQPGKDGNDGNGISGVSYSYDEKNYYITFVFTKALSNGERKQTIEFPIPQVSKWHTGTDEVPNDDELGVDGDYYFDSRRGYIYHKEDGAWKKICQLNLVEQSEKVKVTFDLNASDDSTAKFDNDKLFDGFSSDGTKYIRLDKNYSFASKEKELPTATREGYKFAGWYSVRIPEEYINSMFTDFTTVPSDIILYAKWEKIEG